MGLYSRHKNYVMKGLGMKRKDNSIKICFAASSGGHFEQIIMLKPLMEKYESVIVTEKTKYDIYIKGEKMYYMLQVNREEKACLFRLIINSIKSIKLLIVEKPDVVICTGVLAMVPLCLLCKLMGKKLIFIESFAKLTSPTKSGKLLYKYSDRFYVQWPEMKKIYPNAIYLGGIY